MGFSGIARTKPIAKIAKHLTVPNSNQQSSLHSLLACPKRSLANSFSNLLFKNVPAGCLIAAQIGLGIGVFKGHAKNSAQSKANYRNSCSGNRPYAHPDQKTHNTGCIGKQAFSHQVLIGQEWSNIRLPVQGYRWNLTYCQSQIEMAQGQQNGDVSLMY